MGMNRVTAAMTGIHMVPYSDGASLVYDWIMEIPINDAGRAIELFDTKNSEAIIEGKKERIEKELQEAKKEDMPPEADQVPPEGEEPPVLEETKTEVPQKPEVSE